MSLDIPTMTPWGTPDSYRKLADGIYSYSTPTHGGIWLAPETDAMVPLYMRHEDRWYEEDSDWSIVATVFPHAFDAKDRARAAEIFKNWHPAAWEAWHGKKLSKGESFIADQSRFLRDHAKDQIVITAFGYPVPGTEQQIGADEVLVCAVTGGRDLKTGTTVGKRQTWHIVKASAYRDSGGRFGYVIPEGLPETGIRPYSKRN
jgi:hypothetical protein